MHVCIGVWASVLVQVDIVYLHFEWYTVPTAMPGNHFLNNLLCVYEYVFVNACLNHLYSWCSEVWNFKLNSNGRSAFSFLWSGNERAVSEYTSAIKEDEGCEKEEKEEGLTYTHQEAQNEL